MNANVTKIQAVPDPFDPGIYDSTSRLLKRRE